MIPPCFKLVVIRSTDMNGTMAFYRSLGIDFNDDQHGSGPRHFAADLGGIVFEIDPTKKPEDVDRTNRLGFSLPDIHTAIISIRDLGATIVEEPKDSDWGLRAVVRDPDGRSVELYAEDPPIECNVR